MKNIEQRSLATVFTGDQDEIRQWFDRRQQLYSYPDYNLYQQHKVNLEFLNPKYPYTMIDKEQLTLRDWLEEYTTFYTIEALAKTNSSFKRWAIGQEVQLFLKRFCQDDPIIGITYNKIIEWIFGNSVQKSNDVYTFEWWVLLEYMEKQQWYVLKNGKFSMNTNQNADKKKFYQVITSFLYRVFDHIFDAFTLPEKMDLTFQPIAKEIQESISVNIDFSSSFEQVDTRILPFSPMCIRELDNSMQHGSHIGHEYKLQISFYMKTFLKLEDLKEYFFRHESQNRKYASKEEMFAAVPQIAYQIAHGYKGATESGHGYSSMSCKTCQSVYYCYFCREKLEHIEHDLRSQYTNMLTDEKTKTIADDILQEIIRKIKQVNTDGYSFACTYEMLLRILPFAIDLFPHLIHSTPIEYFLEMKQFYRQKKSILFITHPLRYYQNVFLIAKEWEEKKKPQENK